MDIEERFSVALARLGRVWRSRLDERLKDLGLTQARWMTLLQLSRLGEGVSQRQLAESLAIEGPTLVRLLDGLERQGLVQRRPDAGGDRRVKQVYMTEAGRPLLRRINTVAAEIRREAMEGIDPADLQACLRVFDVIEGRIRKG
jgi:MarR family transcriptional regulator for hemolysin